VRGEYKFIVLGALPRCTEQTRL